MKFRILTTALLICGLAMPAAAQEAASPDETTAAAAAQLGLSLGTTETPQPGDPYILESHGDWDIRCILAPEGQEDPCQLYQRLFDQAGNAVGIFTVFDVPDQGDLVAGASITTPLDTLLSAQLRMRVDDGDVQVHPFTFCQPVGCFVRMALTGSDIAAFRAGGEIALGIVPLQAPDQLVQVQASLVGFTAAYDALSALNQAE